VHHRCSHKDFCLPCGFCPQRSVPYSWRPNVPILPKRLFGFYSFVVLPLGLFHPEVEAPAAKTHKTVCPRAFLTSAFPRQSSRPAAQATLETRLGALDYKKLDLDHPTDPVFRRATAHFDEGSAHRHAQPLPSFFPFFPPLNSTLAASTHVFVLFSIVF